jgi:imidazolonepropionase-like amidohydrolase
MPFRQIPGLISSLIFALSVMVSSGCTAAANPAPHDVIAIVNGTLIDGTGAGPAQDAVLLIQQGGRILAVGKKNEIRVPPEVQVIDARGGTIMPGFINAHVHAAFDEQHLKAWLEGGVTTVRDEGIQNATPLAELMDLQKRVNLDPHLARLVTAGRIISVPNGYGSLPVRSPRDARQQVLAELNAGVNQIKLSMEDGYAGKSGLPKLTQEELSAIITTAHAQKVRVSGHITQAKYMGILVDAGVDDIAHLAYDPIPVETLQKMVDKGIYLEPTFTVFRNYQAPIDICVQNLAQFVRLGGKVALGNDYNGGPGVFELGIPMYEIQMMAQAGMTPMQIILAGTSHAAHVIGLEKEIGTLEPGKIADVLVVNGNPLENLEKLADLRMVIHNGTIVVPQAKE